MTKPIDRIKLYNIILYFSKNVKYSYKTKLIKMIYYLDFNHFKETGASVTNINYEAWGFGPYNKELDEILSNPNEEELKYFRIKNNSNKVLVPAINKFEEDEFSNRELKIMNEIVSKYEKSLSKDLVSETHKENGPWHRVYQERKNLSIPYELVLDELPIDKKEEILNKIHETRHFQSL